MLQDWDKPVAFQLIHDAGWTASTPQSLAATPDNSRSTGLLQEAGADHPAVQVDYVNDPAATNTLILELVEKYNNGWQYDEGQANARSGCSCRTSWWPTAPTARWAASTWTALTEFIATALPIYQASGAKLKDGVTVDDLVTNDFIDPSIHL